jgi:hypothetical protein
LGGVSEDAPRQGRDESEEERLDRQLIELLNEVRVAIPGVQVLFAFLLVVPFSARWERTTELQRDAYFSTLLLTAGATALLMAPAAIHRVRFRMGDKRTIVEWAHRLTIAGMAVLGVAMAGAVFLVTDVLYEVTSAAIAAGGVLGLIVGLWFVLPLSRRFYHRGERPRT